MFFFEYNYSFNKQRKVLNGLNSFQRSAFTQIYKITSAVYSKNQYCQRYRLKNDSVLVLFERCFSTNSIMQPVLLGGLEAFSAIYYIAEINSKPLKSLQF